MSGYTIGEIAGWLLLTALLGFALGWLVRELVGRARPTAESQEPPVNAGPHPGSALPLPDGGAPSGDYVVKVSRGSKIYHTPTSPAYLRTTAAIWFTGAQAAEAAGFRKPKNA